MITRLMTNKYFEYWIFKLPQREIYLKQIDIIEIFIRSMLARLCYRRPRGQFYRLDRMCTCQQYN